MELSNIGGDMSAKPSNKAKQGLVKPHRLSAPLVG